MNEKEEIEEQSGIDYLSDLITILYQGYDVEINDYGVEINGTFRKSDLQLIAAIQEVKMDAHSHLARPRKIHIEVKE